jgi:hypothetical protein
MYCPQNPCSKCNGTGHVTAECSKCRICHEGGHRAAECPSSDKGIRCLRCQLFGHHIRNCPFVECRNCGASGHWLQNCTNKKNEFKNRPTTATATGGGRPVVSIDYHHSNNAAVVAKAGPSFGQTCADAPEAPSKSLMEHFYEKLVARGRNPDLAGQMTLYWQLAEHNEYSLYALFKRNWPCSRDKLRLLFVSELANAPSSYRPMDVTASDLLDATIDYFLPLASAELPTVAPPPPMSRALPAQFSRQTEAVWKEMEGGGGRADSSVGGDYESRLQSLQPLQEFVAAKMRSLSSMFGIQESYIADVSTSIPKLLAEVGLCLNTLRRHLTAFGKDSLADTIQEKMSMSTMKLPDRVSGVYVTTMVTDFLTDFCK